MEGDRQGMAHQHHSIKPGKAGWESLGQPVLSWCWSREAAPSSRDGVAALSLCPAATLFLQVPDERSPGLGLPRPLALTDTESPGPGRKGLSCPRCRHTPAPEHGPCPAASPAAPGPRPLRRHFSKEMSSAKSSWSRRRQRKQRHWNTMRQRGSMKRAQMAAMT